MKMMSAWRFLRRRLGLRNAITDNDLKRGVINIEINHVHGGFFAQINWCLHIFAYARANSVVPRISLISPNYRSNMKKRDWFGDYFRYNSPIQSNKDFWGIRRKRIYHVSELGFRINPDLTLQQAHDVFFETATVHDKIQKEVDAFVQQNFSGHRMLGIHYRGTDKTAEAPRVAFERIQRHLDDLLAPGRFSGIFVASDEQKFINFMLKNVSAVPVLIRDDSRSSLDGNPIHIQPASSVNQLGLDAIVNCMLLSRCHSVLRTSSALSAWASIFNPELRVYLLNRPYPNKLWYPETEILKSGNLLDAGID